MNVHLRWFGRITWLGIAVNAGFWLPALYHPTFIAENSRALWLRPHVGSDWRRGCRQRVRDLAP